MIRTLRALLVTAALTAAGLAGTTALTETPAHAATAASFCFVYDDGNVYRNQSVHLQRWDGRKWVYVKSGTTNNSGCGTFGGLATNIQYQVQASAKIGNRTAGYRVYGGWTPYVTGLGSGTANLGRGVARYITCEPGPNGCW